MATPRTFTVQEVANNANRGLSTVYADIKQGRLVATTNRDGKLVVSASAAKTYNKSLQTGSFWNR